MKKIYIKFEKHSGGCYVYAFVGVKGFRDWYLDRYSYKTGVFLPSNATIGDICKALREDYHNVYRISSKDARKFIIY